MDISSWYAYNKTTSNKTIKIDQSPKHVSSMKLQQGIALNILKDHHSDEAEGGIYDFHCDW